MLAFSPDIASILERLLDRFLGPAGLFDEFLRIRFIPGNEIGID
jgi:hypothetical protein